jgi:hypothetical protein
MSRPINPMPVRPPWGKPADDWSRAKAAEMHAAGYSAGLIIDHLQAYGISLYAAQSLVRNLKRGDPA